MPELRNIATRELLSFFAWHHLPPDLGEISALCCGLAEQMVGRLSDSRELTTGLRKLLEAKDCFVRAALLAREGQDDAPAS
jgi:hypothetical protein